MTDIDLPGQDELYNALAKHAPRAMHVGELCGRLQIPRQYKNDVVRQLLLLVDDGLVREMPGLRFRAEKRGARARKESKKSKREAGRRRSAKSGRRVRHEAPIKTIAPVIEGTLSMTKHGYGFVTVYDGGRDIFIPPDAVGPALHGDGVQVRAQPSRKGREGRVVGIVQRRDPMITGTVRAHGKAAMEFVPDDPRLRSPMRIVGPTKRGVRNRVVLAEIVGFPQTEDEGVDVELAEVLGKQGVAEIEVRKIRIRDGVSEAFADDVRAQADALPQNVERSEIATRTDLRDLDLVTIDPETARDHDDALWAKRVRGGYHVVVAIADVSHYVAEGTPMDREAIARGTSIYLPDRAIPMLPPELSNHLASLVPQRDRLCMAVDIRLDAKGRVTSYKIHEAVMRSRAKISYAGAARALGLTKTGPTQQAAKKRLTMLKCLLELSKLLRDRRLRRGALDFDLPEPKIVLGDKDQEPTEVVKSRKDPGLRQAYRLVEEMMLLANEVVAAHLKKAGVPGVYRSHAPPDAEKLDVFCQLATSLGYQIDLEDASDPKLLSKFLRKIEGTEQESLLRYLLLRAMQQATYDTDPEIGHFGLATKDYLHFTSPIRRYPDLLVHRMVRRLIRGETIDSALWRPKLQRFAVQSSELERRAMIVERDVIDVYRAILMQERIREEFDGTIAGFAATGIYINIDDPFVSVQLPFDELEDDYEPDKLGVRLIGIRSAKVFTLGDKVRIRIEDVNVPERNVLGSLLEHEPTTKPKRGRAAKTSKRRDKAPGRKQQRRQPSGKKRSESRKKRTRSRQGTAAKKRKRRR